MAGLQQWVVGLIVLGMFSIALVAYAISFAESNDAEIDISADPQILELQTGVVGNLSEFSGSGGSGESTFNLIGNSSVASGSQTTTTAGALISAPLTAIAVIKNIFLIGYVKIFGSGGGFGIFLGVVIGLFLVISGFLVWKAWVGGQPN